MTLPERPLHMVLEAGGRNLNNRIYPPECVERTLAGLGGKTLLVVRQAHGLAVETNLEDVIGIASDFTTDASGNLLAEVKLLHPDWIKLNECGVKLAYSAYGTGHVDITTGVVSNYTLESLVVKS